MNLSLSDVFFAGLIIVIVAGLLAGLGELRDWLSQGRELDRVQRLAGLGNERRTPPGPDPALGCRFCRPPFDPNAICGCAGACKDPNCGWLAWPAASNTEEWER